MDIENSNSNAVSSTIRMDAAVDDAVLFGEQYDDSVSGQGKSLSCLYKN